MSSNRRKLHLRWWARKVKHSGLSGKKNEKTNSKHKQLPIEYFMGNVLVTGQKCHFSVITSVICDSNVQIFINFNHNSYHQCVHCNVRNKNYCKVYKRTSNHCIEMKKMLKFVFYGNLQTWPWMKVNKICHNFSQQQSNTWLSLFFHFYVWHCSCNFTICYGTTEELWQHP